MTVSKLKKILSYDKNTGVFTWVKDFRGRDKNGAVKHNIDTGGYARVGIDGKTYKLHRLAFLYMHEYMPKFIDHINHNRSDNRIVNLREVTRLENGRNKGSNVTNTSGCLGVNWSKRSKKWKSTITILGKKIHLGYHIEFSNAVNARKNAEILYGFHENHGKDL